MPQNDWKIAIQEPNHSRAPQRTYVRREWTAADEAKFLQVYRQTHLNMAQAAKAIGKPREVVPYYLRQHPEFARAVQAVREEHLDGAEALIHEKSQESVEVAKWVLERKRPEEWSTTRQVKVEGQITHLHDVKQLTEAQLEGLLQAHQQRCLMLEQQAALEAEYEEVEEEHETPAQNPQKSQD